MDSKKLLFIGSSLSDLIAFPANARREAGFELDKVQKGWLPSDFKTMKSIGAGVQEIRIHDESGAFRVIYVAKFSNAVYVLHAFQKKTQKTSPRDLELATKRYKELIFNQ